MPQTRDTTRVVFAQHLAWLDATDEEHQQRCRLPECGAVLTQEPHGRRKQFCGNKHLREFTKRRTRLDAAIDEVVEMSDARTWSWAERRVIDGRLRWLLDVRAEYMSSREQLALTLEDVEPVGSDQRRTAGRLIRGWLNRPQPDGPICRRCDGTGQNDRLERIERLPRNSRPAMADANDRMRDALRRWWRANPYLMGHQPWVGPLEEFIEEQERIIDKRIYAD